MYRTSISSPILSSHNIRKMPGVTGTTATRTAAYKTTYNSSYSRTPSTQRKTYYYNSSPSNSYGRARSLPKGPGPLSADGHTKLPIDFTVKPKLSTLSRNGPMKADYNSDYTKSYTHYGSSSTNKTLPDSISGLTLHGRRSSSLLNLSALGNDRDRFDKFDHLNNNSSTPKHNYDYSLHSSTLSRTSSRSKQYETTSPDDTSYRSKSGTRRRASFATREEHCRTYEKLVEPKITATLQRESPLSRRCSVKDGVTTSPSHRLEEDETETHQHISSSSGKVSLFGRQSRGKLGLCNVGNTCFMNSVIQSLSNTKPLIEYCLGEDFHLELNKGNSNMKGSLFIAYANLMSSLWGDKDKGYVSPSNFKTQVQRFAPRFMGYQQQDAQEFLRYLLEGLHKDVNRVRCKPKPFVMDAEEEDRLSDSEKAKEYWRHYLTIDNSKIVDMFVGQLKSELKFVDCGHKSVTFDPYWDLSLPIPNGTTSVTLQDCVSLFMKEEELDDEERPTCSKCKARRACKKAFSIQKFPKILVLHLKRFSQEMYRRKLTSLVDFPVSGLDLTEFSAEPGGPKILYNLYAVCNHSGGTHSGHYTAQCKHPYSDEWNLFNDSRVTRTNGQNAVSAEAYVLFYELSSQSARL